MIAFLDGYAGYTKLLYEVRIEEANITTVPNVPRRSLKCVGLVLGVHDSLMFYPSFYLND